MGCNTCNDGERFQDPNGPECPECAERNRDHAAYNAEYHND